MSRLLVASNRVGDFRSGFQAGGLAVALCSMLKTRGGLWFGAAPVESGIDALERGSTSPAAGAQNVEICTIPIENSRYRSYYEGFSNSVLWPVLHNRLDLAHFDNDFFTAYEEVNAKFADAIVATVRSDDVIWVHDYHLLLLGAQLRARGVQNPIGFFLHTPFPPGEVFASVSQHQLFGDGLSRYDMIGLQTRRDTAAFLDYLQRFLGGRILNDGRIRLGETIISCGSYPIGIDTAEFAKAAVDDDGKTSRGKTAAPATTGTKRIIGVDRLDYTKGLIQRFEAFGQFLEDNPHRHGSVSFVQIAPPTREGLNVYRDIESEIARLAGSINGKYSDMEWIPIRYIHRAYPRNHLAGFYRDAAVGLVTPLQDGMNLVAKEYVAAQDPDDPGVLILSKFAGAAETMQGALLINPYDLDELALAIERALAMPREERIDRHSAMYDEILEHDVHGWADRFIRNIEASAVKRYRGTGTSPLAIETVRERTARTMTRTAHPAAHRSLSRIKKRILPKETEFPHSRT